MSKLSTQRTPQQDVGVIFDNAINTLNLQVSSTTRRKLQASLQQPTLASLSTAFNKLRVDTLALRLDVSQLSEIPFPAIAHLTNHDGHFVLITKLDENQLTYHNPLRGWVTEHIDAFASNWSGATLLLDAKPLSGDPDYEVNQRTERLAYWRRVVGIGLLLILVASSIYTAQNWTNRVSGLLFMLGTILSGLLIAADLGNSTARALCKVNKKTDCHNVLTSPGATLFGWLKMSEIGWVWFFGSWLSVWLGNLSASSATVLGGLGFMSLLAAFYVPYSIGYQWLVIKQWCPLCLAVQAVLVVSAWILSSSLRMMPALLHDYQAQYCLGIGFGISLLSWLFFKPFLHDSHELPIVEKKLSDFQSNNDVFKLLLAKQQKVENINYPLDVVLGPNHARFNVILVSSLFCTPCAHAHKVLESLLEQMQGQLSVTVRFMVDPVSEAETGYRVALHMLSLRPGERVAASHEWFRTQNYATWSAKFPTSILPAAEKALLRQLEWNRANAIMATPALFLDCRPLPIHYKAQDLAYHLPNLIDS